jgi:hypothetical protein
MTEKIVTAKAPLAFSEALEVLKQSKAWGIRGSFW